MKVSVIVAVYKDIEALNLIIQALKNQTYSDFEVIIVEDGNSIEMKEYISTIKDLNIKHTTQEDIGVRKASSQNNGLLAAEGEYLIFIDGDCIPFANFIEGHVALADEKTVLSGRRVNIPIHLVEKIKQDYTLLLNIERNYWKYIFWAFNKQIRYRQGIYINPQSLLYKLISKRDVTTSLLGCNFSCFKQDMLELNGFDESYGETAIPDDMDWEWRFQAAGLTLKSCKNVANMFHLDHKIHDRGDATPYLEMMNERKKAKTYICEEGLNTHNV